MVLSMCVAFGLGVMFAGFRNGEELSLPSQMGGRKAPAAPSTADATASSTPPPRHLLDLPAAVKYVYINIGTSWDPWPGCGTKGTKGEIKNGHGGNDGGLPYDPEVFCVMVEPLLRVVTGVHERGQVTNTSIMIHTAVGPSRGLAPFYEYAGVSGVASSLSVINEVLVEREVASGAKGPYSAGARGQTFSTTVTLKDILDIIPDRVRILQMKTDMQGFDVTAIRSAGKDVARIDEIYHECYGDGEINMYEGAPVPNTYQNAKAILEPYGFESGKERAHDCNWRRKGAVRLPGRKYIGNW